jgi:hypothetical protein
MNTIRNVIADVLVGLVVVLVAVWLLRGVLHVVYWGATLVAMVLVIAVVLRIASKIRS